MTRLFHVRAMADPQTLPRVLGYFAQRWITPDRIDMRAGRTDMEIRIEVADLDQKDADILTAKLRETVLVHEIQLMLLCEQADADRPLYSPPTPTAAA